MPMYQIIAQIGYVGFRGRYPISRPFEASNVGEARNFGAGILYADAAAASGVGFIHEVVIKEYVWHGDERDQVTVFRHENGTLWLGQEATTEK